MNPHHDYCCLRWCANGGSSMMRMVAIMNVSYISVAIMCEKQEFDCVHEWELRIGYATQIAQTDDLTRWYDDVNR
jgi:hypothetical protein